MQLAALVNDDRFVSLEGKSKHEMWADLCTLITRRPEKITSLNVDAIIRGGIRRYTQEVGRLWCALADYYIRLGLFEKARDVYEEAIEVRSRKCRSNHLIFCPKKQQNEIRALLFYSMF